MEAADAAQALEQEGYAHHLPGARERWVFSSQPISLEALMRALDQEYPEFVGEGDDPQDEAIQFIRDKFGVDRAVADELLVGLEAAGYTSRIFSPAHQRDRLLFEVSGVLHRI